MSRLGVATGVTSARSSSTKVAFLSAVTTADSISSSLESLLLLSLLLHPTKKMLSKIMRNNKWLIVLIRNYILCTR